MNEAQMNHLVEGLKRIVALKDTKEVKDPISILLGEDNDGWTKIHPRMLKGLKIASEMAQKILDTMPKNT